MTTSSTKVRGGNCDTCDAQDCVCPPGPQGSRGAAGATGATGATGTPGINGPGVRVTRDAPFEVPLPNVDTAVVFQASRFNDLPPLWTVGAPDRFVVGAGQAGKYQISGSVIWAADTGVFYSTSIFVNGVPGVTATDVTPTPDVLGQEVSTHVRRGGAVCRGHDRNAVDE